jgi:hypothetical protein
VIHPVIVRLPKNKKAAAQRIKRWPQLFLSNIRLTATMRSRSKKGEVGLCCAQPLVDPGQSLLWSSRRKFNRIV